MTTRQTRKCLFSCLAICLLLVLGMPGSAEATLQPEGIKYSLPEQSGSVWVETLSAGFSYTCGLKSDGTVACWGLNDDGQSTPPGGTFTQISAGYSHTCGLKSDGTVACWGDNFNGQASPPAGTFTQISAGAKHNCGVRSDGTLACWGDNFNGQASPPAGTFTQVSGGYVHSCGVKSDSTVVCWGDNHSGQSTPPSGMFTQVSAGDVHNCGMMSDDTLACWGNDYYGQSTLPAGMFIQISAGNLHTCGLKSDGTVACWGLNDKGQSTPPAGTFTQVSAGVTHNCGMRSDGTIVCWGDNTEGQSSPYPTPYTIYGKPGAHWVTLSYDDGSLKTVTSDGYGEYSISVPYNWSGTITPSKAGYTFTPPNREYVNVTADQVNQDYTAYKSFADVPADYSVTLGGITYDLFTYIEALYDAGYTAGCLTDPPRYCPDNTMTRAESAVFMLRGEFGSGYVPPGAPWGSFADDWSPGPWAEKWAEGMLDAAMTAGCLTDPLRFCPWDQLPRVQAAVFGLRMMHGMTYTPPDATGTLLADMTDTGYWGTKWAEKAYLDGLLPACGTSGGKPMFCPNDLFTRAWGAYLIVKAKYLPLTP